MAFLPNIPQPNDTLSVSQGNLLNNFQLLGAIAGNTNASSASINATSGFNWLFLPVQAGSPPAAAAFPAGQLGLYSFLNPAVGGGTGLNELYINKTTNIGLTQIPITAGLIAVPGWAYSPAGLIYKWGNVGANANSVTVTMVGPAITNILAVILSAAGSGNFALRTVVGLTNTNAPLNQFTAYCNGHDVNTRIHYWVVCQP